MIGKTIYSNRLHAQEPIMGEKKADGIERKNKSGQSPKVCWLSSESGHDGTTLEALEHATRPRPLRNLGLALGIRPEALQATVDIAQLAGMGGSGLGKRIEGIIGLVVAATTWIPYMGTFHAGTLAGLSWTVGEIRSLVDDPSGGILTGREQQIASYAERLTRCPTEVVHSDMESLRDWGPDDAAILTVAASVSVENILCRVSAGMEVSIEDDRLADAGADLFS